jgi:diguanylate cyclase (GGDEF)-like protein
VHHPDPTTPTTTAPTAPPVVDGPPVAPGRPRPTFALLTATIGWAAVAGWISTRGGHRVAWYQLAVWVPLPPLLAPLLRRGVERSWRMVGAGVLFFALGDVAWDAITLAGQDPAASWADGVYLAGYVALFAGIAVLLRRHGGPDRRNGLLDGVLLAVPTVVVVVQFLVVPGDDTTQSVATRVVAALYPLADVLVVAGLVWLLVTPALPRRVLALLATGMAATLAVDVLGAVASLRGAGPALSVADALYPLTYVLLAAGASLGATTPLRDPVADDHVLPWGRVVLLAAGLVAAPLAAVLGTVDDLTVEPVLVVGATLVAAGLVVVRFVGLVHRLNRTARELAAARDEIEELAVRDPLTGLYNRLVLPQQLAVLSTGTGPGAALVSIDLDRFKQVNDRFGHAAGDTVLEVVADRLVRVTRRGDAVIRMGGDEFLLVLWGLDEAAALDLATRIVAAIEEPIRSGEETLHVSASVGVAVVGGGGLPATEDLLQAADQAMYRAKRRGSGGVQLVSA